MNSTTAKSLDYISSVSQLEDLLATPTFAVIDLFKRLSGDILLLGVSGKIGPSLARMAKRASELAGVDRRIIGVSRFGSQESRKQLEEWGIETIAGDLLDREFLAKLPDCENVIFLAGMKFGSRDNQARTWAVNTYLPGMVAERFKDSRIIAYSTGCVYPFVTVKSGGATEETPPEAVGEYAQSCLGRERMFQYGSENWGTPVTIIRLNYAVELRYGVLLDIALKVKNSVPIDLSMGWANVIWQGDANAAVLRSLEICDSPAKILNVTGPETMSVRWAAGRFGQLFGVEPVFRNEEQETCWLNNAAYCHRLFGYPEITLEQIILWTARWLDMGLPLLDKPTHFDTRNGKY